MQITLSVKDELYRDYLKGIFELSADGSYKVTKYHDFGKLLISMIRYSKHPTPKRTGESMVTLELPSCRSLASAEKNYLYLLKEDEAKLIDQLEVIFSLDYSRHCIEGEKLRFQKKDIVESFIVTRKLIKLIGDNETLKKREYRDSLKFMKIYTERLLKKSRDNNFKIKNAIKHYNPLTVI